MIATDDRLVLGNVLGEPLSTETMSCHSYSLGNAAIAASRRASPEMP